MTDSFFHPVSGFDVPRFAGVPTFMRLPHLSLDDPRLKEVLTPSTDGQGRIIERSGESPDRGREEP